MVVISAEKAVEIADAIDTEPWIGTDLAELAKWLRTEAGRAAPGVVWCCQLQRRYTRHCRVVAGRPSVGRGRTL